MPSIAHADLLLALVRGDWDAAEAQHANKPVDTGFAEACSDCDVHPQIHTLLEKHGRLHLAGAAEQALAKSRTKVRHDNMLLIGRTEQALDALLQRSVRPLALKGFDLIHRIYSFDERTLDDVDLLVIDLAIDVDRDQRRLGAIDASLEPRLRLFGGARFRHIRPLE